MSKLHNPTIRLFHLPGLMNDKEEVFGHRVMLRPQSVLEVPEWYLKELLGEKNRAGQPTGWALRLEKTSDGARVVSPSGAAGSFEARIKAYRAEKAQAEREAKGAEQRAKAAEQRLEAIETELASQKRESSGSSGKSSSSKSKGSDDKGGSSKSSS